MRKRMKQAILIGLTIFNCWLFFRFFYIETETFKAPSKECNLEAWYLQNNSASNSFMPSIFSFGKQTYFDKRAKALENMKIVFRPQPSGSKVDPWYYHHHVPYQHNFKKVINEPTLCSQHEKVFLLYTVRTIYDHFDRREVLRNIFSNIPEDSCAKGVPIKHLFLFGKPNNSTIESLIQKESEMYHDILLEDFKESYVNVSIKAIMAWKYSVEFCANAEYVAVMNDEAFIDLNRMVSWLGHDLSKGKYDDHFALCYRIGDSPALHKHIKQFTYLDEEILYRGDFYPPYCHGFGYIAPINVINKLYLAALQNAYYMPTDVWIGVLAEMLNINIINHEHQYIFTGVLKHYASGKYQKSPTIVAICDFENLKSETGKLMRQLYQVIYN